MKKVLLLMFILSTLALAEIKTKVLFIGTYQPFGRMTDQAEMINEKIDNFIKQNKIKKIINIDLEKVGDDYYFVTIVYEQGGE